MTYPPVVGDEDDGTMPANLGYLADQIVGHRIVSASYDPSPAYGSANLRLTLDNGKTVKLFDSNDCCAYTELRGVIEHLPTVDHIITKVEPNAGYTAWFIVADFGQVMELEVGWSSGNPFYYGYGFHIEVTE